MASGLIQFAFVLASGIINIMPNERNLTFSRASAGVVGALDHPATLHRLKNNTAVLMRRTQRWKGYGFDGYSGSARNNWLSQARAQVTVAGAGSARLRTGSEPGTDDNAGTFLFSQTFPQVLSARHSHLAPSITFGSAQSILPDLRCEASWHFPSWRVIASDSSHNQKKICHTPPEERWVVKLF
ncbi:hypothetical protein ACJJTC_016325 [Scirpophaga incertulas]